MRINAQTSEQCKESFDVDFKAVLLLVKVGSVVARGHAI